MTELENRPFKKAGILNLITKNYKLPSDVLDLEALIDDEISMSENWHNTIKPKVKRLLDYQSVLMFPGMMD